MQIKRVKKVLGDIRRDIWRQIPGSVCLTSDATDDPQEPKLHIFALT